MCLNKYRMQNPKLFFVCLAFLLSLPDSSQAQMNLVPNPSFEIHDSCPDFHSQISMAVGWSQYQVTPDYYHKCATNWIVSVPRNMGGYQVPFVIDDSAYVGAITSVESNGLHEIFGIALTDPLIIGQRYYVSFYISAGSGTHSLCYSNKFGVKFITYLANLGATNPDLVDDFAHVYEDSIVSDTSNWKLFRESFIADSAYTGILLGNFFTSGNLNYFCWTSGTKSTYNYIDNICVSLDTNYCDVLNSEIEIGRNFTEFDLSISAKQIRITLNRDQTSRSLIVFDLAGRVVMEREVYSGTNSIDFSHLTSGMYLIYFNHRVYKIIHSP